MTSGADTAHEEEIAAASSATSDEAAGALPRWEIAALIALCLAGVAARLLFAWRYLPPLESDFYWYRIAGLAAARHGLASLFSANPPVPVWVLSLWPPGYPLFLGLLYSVNDHIWVAPVAQAILGGLTCFAVFAAARRWGGNAWAAAAIVAFYPQAIVYSAIHGTETLSVFLLALGIAASLTPLGDRQAVGYGVSLGLATLTRAHTLLLVPGVVASLWHRGRALVLVLLATALVLTPWSVSRSMVYHRPVFMTTFFGHLLYMGNWRDNTTGGYWEAPRPLDIPGDATPPEEDVYYLAAGVREILLRPFHYLYLSARRMVMWTGVDRDEWVEKYAPKWLAGLSMLAQLALFFAAITALVEAWRDPRARFISWPALSILLLTALSYHMPRYTLVILPYFAVIASRLRTDWGKV
ncbi:MAG: hypothetical protein ACE149_01680 [Armatimonadota bacterium]